MYATSTQLQNWTFSSSEELEKMRFEANKKYSEKLSKKNSMQGVELLTAQEENSVRLYYESKLKRLCGRFQPPIPRNVFATAMNYLKRIYLNTSVMEPRIDDIIHTCLFMACKVEDFYLSIMQFVANLPGDTEDQINRVLANEMLVLEKLNFQLNVHNPFKASDGFLIDIKTRCSGIGDVMKLRLGIDQFISKSMLTDVPLLFTPSQIALAAVVSSATNVGLNMNIDSYVANKLLSNESYELQQKITGQLQRMKHMVRNAVELTYDEVTKESFKLNIILNSLNKAGKHGITTEGDEETARKRPRLDEEEYSNDYNEFESD